MSFLYQPELKSSYSVPSAEKNASLYPATQKQQSIQQFSYPSQAETYYQPLQYQTATGRSINRTASPLLIQNHQKYPSSSSGQSQAAVGGYVPSYYGAYSADKNISSAYSDAISKPSYLSNPYATLQSYNKTAAYSKQPQVSTFTVADNANPEGIKVDAKPINNATTALNIRDVSPPPASGQINSEERQFFPNPPVYHARAFSLHAQDDYATPPQPLAPLSTKGESCSPSKRVTFNLAKNIYTDIEQIEKRLNEQKRLREQEEAAAVSTATRPTMEKVDIDIHRRFDNAINRSEKIINEFLRVGRESAYTKIPRDSDQLGNDIITISNNNNNPNNNTPTKTGFNPSRSKSPIKPSLKKTLSFTTSPQRPTIGNSIPYQRNETLTSSPLSNQTNKITNGIGNDNPQRLQADESKQSSTRQQDDLKGSFRQRDDFKPVSGQLEDLKASSQHSYLPSKVPLQSTFYPLRERLSTSTLLQSQQPQQKASFAQNENISISDYQRSLTPPPKLQDNNPQKFLTVMQPNPNQQQQPQTQPSYHRILGNTSLIPSEISKTINSTNSLSSASKENQDNSSNEENKGKIEINPNNIGTATKTPSAASPQPRKGVLKYSDGSRYTGFILNEKRCGHGTLMSDSFQVIYQGDWKNDTYHGKGKFFNPLAENLQEDYDYTDFDVALSSYWESYEGEFLDGKLDGYGTLMLTNGEKLVGNFKKGRISGKGTFTCSQNQIITGNWEDNRLIERL